MSAVRTERQAEDHVLVAVQAERFAGIGLVPDANEAVAAAGGESAVMTERQAQDAVRQAIIIGQHFAIGQAPQLDFAALGSAASSGNQDFLTRTERQAGDRAFVAAQRLL